MDKKSGNKNKERLQLIERIAIPSVCAIALGAFILISMEYKQPASTHANDASAAFPTVSPTPIAYMCSLYMDKLADAGFDFDSSYSQSIKGIHAAFKAYGGEESAVVYVYEQNGILCFKLAVTQPFYPNSTDLSPFGQHFDKEAEKRYNNEVAWLCDYVNKMLLCLPHNSNEADYAQKIEEAIRNIDKNGTSFVYGIYIISFMTDSEQNLLLVEAEPLI